MTEIAASPGRPDMPADDPAALIYATGPASYDYIFGGMARLAPIIRHAWRGDGTLYSHETASVVMDGSTMAGIEIGYAGEEFYARRDATAGAAAEAMKAGAVSFEDLTAIAEKADKASYLNAWVPPDVYYLMALAVPESQRGRGIGKALLQRAIDRARASGYRALHLDVLSDNPAVGLYTAMGLICVAETIAPEPCRVHGIPMEMRMAITL